MLRYTDYHDSTLLSLKNGVRFPFREGRVGASCTVRMRVPCCDASDSKINIVYGGILPYHTELKETLRLSHVSPR